MKKKQRWIILTVILTMLLTACGATGAKTMEADSAVEMTEPMEAPMFMAQNSSAAGSMKEETTADGIDFAEPEAEEGRTMEPIEDFSEKIIYTGNVYIETTEFDTSLQALNSAVTQYGGFVQDSNVSGRSSGDKTAVLDRYAFYAVRVPAERFEEFMSMTGQIGNVTSSGRNAQNVTSQYTDHEARLSSLLIQEERLLAMLEQSGDLESLIALEERLSEVRYEIESIERSLRDLDQRLAYSTVYVEVQEVEVYTQTLPVQRSFGEKISDAFCGGWESFVLGVQNFAIGAVEALPTLILLAAALTIVIVVVRRKIKKRKAKAETAEKEE